MNTVVDGFVSTEFQLEKAYYISGKGIHTYRGVLGNPKGHDLGAIPRQFREGVIHRFQPDQNFGGHDAESLVADGQVKQGWTVHRIPSPAEMERILRIVLEQPSKAAESSERLHQDFSWMLKTANVEKLAEIIRDGKPLLQQDTIVGSAVKAMANVLAYHLESLPGEALDYIQLLTGVRTWPQGLPAVPQDQRCMNLIVKRRKDKKEFSPEFIAMVGGHSVAASFTKTPSSSPTPNSTDLHIPGIQDISRLFMHAQEQSGSGLGVGAGDSKLEAVSPAGTQLSGTQNEMPADAEDRQMIGGQSTEEALGNNAKKIVRRFVPKVKPVKYLNSYAIDKSGVFTHDSVIYGKIKTSLKNATEFKILEAAVDIMTQGHAIDLSRLLLIDHRINIGNIATAKNKDLDEEEKWTAAMVRDHYQGMLDQLVERLAQQGNLTVEDRDNLIALYQKIHPNYKPSASIIFKDGNDKGGELESDTAEAVTLNTAEQPLDPNDSGQAQDQAGKSVDPDLSHISSGVAEDQSIQNDPIPDQIQDSLSASAAHSQKEAADQAGADNQGGRRVSLGEALALPEIGQTTEARRQPYPVEDLLRSSNVVGERGEEAAIQVFQELGMVKLSSSRVPSALDMGLTPNLAETFAMAAKVAKAYMATVVLLGESGVGKTRLAKHIHDRSPRAQFPFKIIDLSQSSNSNLFESELFGHEVGAFTGAVKMRKSPFEEADKGTVFLDEIGTLDLSLQMKLMRLIQEGTFRRVGGNEDITADTRVIVATSYDLEEMVKEKRFREDLYYRLNVVKIHVPSLRDRRDDVLPLAEYFLELASRQERLPKKRLSHEAGQLLLRHDWPGNVRSLENEMRRATIMTDSEVIQVSDLSFGVQG